MEELEELEEEKEEKYVARHNQASLFDVGNQVHYLFLEYQPVRDRVY